MSDYHDHRGAYAKVFLALMALLVLTVGVAFIHFGGFFNLFIALAIACFKALLVMLYFMHVKYSERLVWVFSGLAGAFLLIGAIFTFADYFTRV